MIQQQQTYFLELYRAGIRTASDIAKASLENAQRLQSQQMEAVRQALEANVRSARQLSEANSLTDLMALQVKLAGTQAEQVAELWTRTWRTASETQVAMLGQVQTQVGQLSDKVRETYSHATRIAQEAVNSSAEEVREAERKVQRAAR
jgi:phasin family protein